MNRKEYKEYQTTVEAFFALEEINCLNAIQDSEDEREFTSQHCDCCGCGDGRKLVPANGYSPTSNSIKEYWCCNACLLYCDTGELDDMTMLSIAEEPSD